MKSIFFVASVSLLCLTAQAGFILGGNIGIAHPTGDLGDFVDTGYNINGFVEYFFSEPMAARFDIGYHSMEGDEIGIDYTYSAFYVDALFDYHFGDMKAFHPYGLVGVGLYSWETEADVLYYKVSTDDTDPGFVFGGGIRYPLSSFDLNAEALGHYVFYEDDEELTVTFGVGVAFGM